MTHEYESLRSYPQAILIGLNPGHIPVEQVKTICTECANYRAHDFCGRYCKKAKLLTINPVNGSRTWESNYAKNRGDCSDFEARPEPTPKQIEKVREEFRNEYRVATWPERIKAAWVVLWTGKVKQ